MQSDAIAVEIHAAPARLVDRHDGTARRARADWAGLGVRKVYRDLPQWWGVVWLVWGAHSVVELPAGSTRDIDLNRGDQVVIN